jgi:acetoin utilization protein AcuB
MKVKRFMISNPITATPKTNYSEAMHLMRDNHIHHLPIVDAKGNLIGVVSHSDMLSATPSPVTSLSVFEIYSLLDKVTMADIMSKPALAVEEDCSLAAAAQFMIDKGIGCLPVMHENKLVGIITDTDIFKVFVEAMGGNQPGSYVEVQMPDEKGQLASTLGAMVAAGSYIVSVSLIYDKPGYATAAIKERGGDEKKLQQEMEKLGTAEILEFRPHEKNRLLSFG